MVEPRKRLRWPIWSAVLAGFLIFAYPLSVGPALRLTADGYLPKAYVTVIYWPLEFIFERAPVAFQNIFTAYLSFWVPEFFRP